MDGSFKTKRDGINTTTLARIGILIKGCNMEETVGLGIDGWKQVVVRDDAETLPSSSSPSSSSLSSASSLLSLSSSLLSYAPCNWEMALFSYRANWEGCNGIMDGIVGDNRKRKAMKMGRKKAERKETEGKETEGKRMERKEIERKELEGKALDRKEMIRKELEKKMEELKDLEVHAKILDWVKLCGSRYVQTKDEIRKVEEGIKTVGREIERMKREWMEMEKKEMERKEMERKEMERREMRGKELERKETERKEMERKDVERKEMVRKEKAMVEKEKERKEKERKEMERIETERKKTEGKETEKCVIKIQECTTELVTRLHESERENLDLREEIRRLKSSLRISLERLSKLDAAVKTAQSTKMGLLSSEGNAVPPLREEFSSLPPLPQRTIRNTTARRDGDRISSAVQSPPPMVYRGSEGVETCKETHKGGRPHEGVSSGSETEWRLVDGGRRRRRKDPSNVLCSVDKKVVHNLVERRSPIGQQPKGRPPRLPLSSAVAINGRTEGFSYAAALKSARENIDLEALGINETRIRKAANGGLLIEVLGEDSRMKAEKLGLRIRDVLRDSAAVSCPTKKSELHITGFDESVSAEEIVRVISSFGGCTMAEVKTGPIRTLGSGLRMVWVQLPTMAAIKLVDIQQVRLGWMMARVELLKTRPLQCFRCWRYGHTQSMCHSVVDRRNACFRCGQLGHLASACQNKAFCAVCHDAGVGAMHRLGGPLCVTQVGKQRSTTSSTKGSE